MLEDEREIINKQKRKGITQEFNIAADNNLSDNITTNVVFEDKNNIFSSTPAFKAASTGVLVKHHRIRTRAS